MVGDEVQKGFAELRPWIFQQVRLLFQRPVPPRQGNVLVLTNEGHPVFGFAIDIADASKEVADQKGDVQLNGFVDSDSQRDEHSDEVR